MIFYNKNVTGINLSSSSNQAVLEIAPQQRLRKSTAIINKHKLNRENIKFIHSLGLQVCCHQY